MAISFGNNSTANANAATNPNNDYTISESIMDGISDLSWSPNANILVAGSWDNNVRCWEIQQQGTQLNAVAKAQMSSHEGPVLCTAFSGDGSTVFSGSCDKSAKMWQLASGNNQAQTIAMHEAPIRCISAIAEANVVVTGSWDKTIKYWDTRSSTPQATVQLSERCYAMDVKYPLMIVGTADRRFHVYDLRKPTEVFRTIESPLKYQTRCVSCFPDKTGFAVGSIEGRVGIHHIDTKDDGKNFAFRCHRDDSNIYPISSINFHPLGPFSTTGGDGAYNFWDKDTKTKLKGFAKTNQAITVGKFNSRGDIFAYGVSYDWSKGAEHYNQSFASVIRLHYTVESDVVKKKK